MPRLIDCFMFFNEYDLLEIRLKYLYDIVDEFIIVEAAQTFMGEYKPFNFEDQKHRYKQYLPKITYYKVEGFHLSLESVKNYLEQNHGNNSITFKKIATMLEKHSHYDKKKLYYVLDTYHRESIHLPLAHTAKEDDIVIISDLDEIPSRAAIHLYLKGDTRSISAFKQHEFSFYLNYYKNSDWIGSVIAPYSLIQAQSFNELRIDSKKLRHIVSKELLSNGGYHFTTCGSITQIKEKLSAWAHPEFNTKRNNINLEHNMRTGQDPFGRSLGTIFQVVCVDSTELYDNHIKLILSDYPRLLTFHDLDSVSPTKVQKLIFYMAKLAQKAYAKLPKRIH
ncbi:hypothetical protein [Cyanobium sp. FACHB-13342]|uniref:hypothetical protein n=1 Tax=Cyanobium sp. FACHB-13342 TaxID=2692793 RepID=UPI001681031E|nr:hypothetical protein [Cyanobium sp. FACHB-13342]MBD2423787.1 hypothetical protein [Cyanobium sp. FACHB-13342]